MIEIVSPGNKNNQNGLNSFVRKAHEMLAAGVHLLLIDLFPPGSRDPHGIHPIVSGRRRPIHVRGRHKPLTCVAYSAGPDAEAFVETFAVGDRLRDMPLSPDAGSVRVGPAGDHLRLGVGGHAGVLARGADGGRELTTQQTVWWGGGVVVWLSSRVRMQSPHYPTTPRLHYYHSKGRPHGLSGLFD